MKLEAGENLSLGLRIQSFNRLINLITRNAVPACKLSGRRAQSVLSKTDEPVWPAAVSQ